MVRDRSEDLISKCPGRESIPGRGGGCAKAPRSGRGDRSLAGAGGGPHGVEAEGGGGRAAGSLVGHGTQFQFYSKATGSLWWVVSKEASESDLHF